MDNANKNENLLNLSNIFDEYDEELLKLYIGRNYDKITSKVFNVWAFLLNIIYLLYRKMYLLSLVVGLLFLLVCFINNIVVYFIYILLVGFFTNNLYVSFAKKNINRIKLKYKDRTIDDVKRKCKNVGGTNIVFGLLAIALEVGLIVLGYILMSYGDKLDFSKSEYNPFFNPEEEISEIPEVDKILDTDDDNETSETDDSTKTETEEEEDKTKKEKFELPGMYKIVNEGIDILSIIISDKYDGEIEPIDDEDISNSYYLVVPQYYKNNSKHYIYDYEYSKLGHSGKCSLKFYASEDYLSAKKLVKEMIKYYESYGSSKLEKINMNNIDWYSFTTDYQNKTHYYISKKNNKVFVFEYNIEYDAPEECETNFKHIVQSITEK